MPRPENPAPSTSRFTVSDLRMDLFYALRQLLAHRSWALSATVILALGMAVVISIFSVVHSVLLAPLPLPEGERIVTVNVRAPEDQAPSQVVAPMEFAAWGDHGSALDALTVLLPAGATLETEGLPERVQGFEVSSEFFTVTRAPIVLGRSLDSRDFEVSAQPAVVLGHQLWQRSFGGSQEVLGRSLRLDGVVHRVVGVLGPEIDDLYQSVDYCVPLVLRGASLEQPASYLLALGRLPEGIAVRQAEEHLATLQETVNRRRASEDRRSVVLVPLRQVLVGEFRQRLLLLFGAVFLVLLIACGNVSNLLLAQGLTRRRELAIRSAIGAGRWRILRQLLLENLLVASAAAALGAGLALLLIRAFVRFAPEEVPGLETAALDPPVLGFTFLLAVFTSLVAGCLPSWRATRSAESTLRTHGPTGSRDRLRPLLVIVQIGLTFPLLIAAGLLIQSSIAESAVDPGFEPESLLTASLSLPRASYPETPRVVAAFDQILARGRALPGVTQAALGSRVPLAGPSLGVTFAQQEAVERSVDSGFRIASREYFRTAGIELLAGEDLPGPAEVAPRAVINQAFARALFGDEDPIGRRLVADNRAFLGAAGEPLSIEIVGVVESTRGNGLRREPRPELFMTPHQAPAGPLRWLSNTLVLLLRTEVEPRSVIAPLRHVVAEVDPALPLFDVETMSNRMAAEVQVGRFTGSLFAVLASTALLLAGAGIYSLTLFFVARRENEIGLRIALGATRQQVMREVLSGVIRPAILGLSIGIVLAQLASSWLESQLFGVAASDPKILVLMAATLAATVALAGWKPAQRILGIDPINALRAE